MGLGFGVLGLRVRIIQGLGSKVCMASGYNFGFLGLEGRIKGLGLVSRPWLACWGCLGIQSPKSPSL